MKKIALCVLVFIIGLTVSLPSHGEGFKRLYRGKVGDRPVRMYLVETVQQCDGSLVYQGMYRYDNQPHWLQLEITANQKKQFVMVEENFSGVLLLNATEQSLTGNWISPDQMRKLPVKIDKTDAKAKEIDVLEKQYDELNYENHDC